MNQKNSSTTDARLERIESDLATIKHLLRQLLSSSGKGYTESEEAILSVKQIAAYLGVEPTAVYAKCAKGQLPFYKVGKLYRFKKSEVIKWMEEGGEMKKVDIDDYVNSYLQRNVLKG